MLYTLAAAATATGLSRSAILRAIKSGKIFATKDELGEWRVEPAELHLVFPPVAMRGGGSDRPQRFSSADLEDMTAQIEALLRQAGDRLRQQFDAVRRDRDGDRHQGQATQLRFAEQEEQLS
jgi:hypothetical protein